MAENWIIQHYLASSPVAVTDLSTTPAEQKKIYRGNDESVFLGFPADGKLSYFRAGSEDIGEANTNLLKPAAFDWPLDVAGIGFQVSIPRSVVEGADLFNADDGLPPLGAAAGLAARRLASHYTRFFELFINNSMLFFWIAEDIIAQVPLDWVGSGPMVWTEGLSIWAGELETYPDGQGTVNPSVAAFSCRIGFEGKKDLWNLMTPDEAGKKFGARIVEQQGFRLYTMTDANIVGLLNRIMFAATGGGPGLMWDDRRVGIRFTASLFGDRTIRANYGAMGGGR